VQPIIRRLPAAQNDLYAPPAPAKRWFSSVVSSCRIASAHPAKGTAMLPPPRRHRWSPPARTSPAKRAPLILAARST